MIVGGERYIDATASATASATTSATTSSLERDIKAQAFGLGFDLVGITVLGEADTADAFDRWLAHGYAGEMHYLPRWANKRRDSRLPFAGVSSAIVVALDYGGRAPSGPVARYARGDDYHDVMVRRLEALHLWLAGRAGRVIRGKAYVDTGPILERDIARRAGLGWFGRNTMLINPDIGSFFFIGALFVDLELQADAPFDADRCGTCTRCLEACPTGALVADHVLDATRCISYLTIEQRGAIPEAVRPAIGGLVYGCDICQEVCPWNIRFARDVREPAFRAREPIATSGARALARDLLGLDDETFRETFRGSAMKRAKRSGLARNAAVVLGNVGDAEDVPALAHALNDADPLVREHAAWAVRQIVGRAPVVAAQPCGAE